MDMDYRKDKGAYVFTEVRKDMALTEKDLLSWNELPRDDGLKSTGLYSRISPDGKWIASTVNEVFLLVKTPDPYFSQLFFPLQGNLAFYSSATKTIGTLPGADLPGLIQTDPSWSPGGDHLLFSRAPDRMDLFWDLGGQTVFSATAAEGRQFNKEYQVRFDIYRIPFDGGRGGLAEPLAGASHNGKSNYYPRYSPDGKWIVFTQSETGLAIQPDSRLFIMPATGGEARMMHCNLATVNSWHTWSPNGRWLAFVSKGNSPYTELFLTHVDAAGNDSPPILLDRFNKEGYAVNVPEFANMPADAIDRMTLH
jgi:dipeptidyl aminopeptidase/acylaminoacyl peptidase